MIAKGGQAMIGEPASQTDNPDPLEKILWSVGTVREQEKELKGSQRTDNRK